MSVQTATTVVARGLVRTGTRCGEHGTILTRHHLTLRWDTLAPAEVRMDTTPWEDGGPTVTITLPRDLLDVAGTALLTEVVLQGTRYWFERSLLAGFLAASQRLVPSCFGCGSDECAMCSASRFDAAAVTS